MTRRLVSGVAARVPGVPELLRVYGVIAIMIYGWTILWFFWRLRSWLFFLNAGQIATIGAYALATNLLESLLVLCALVLAGMILPGRLLRDRFAAKGSALAISGLGYMMYIAQHLGNQDDYPSLLLNPWSVAAALLVALLIAAVCSWVRPLNRAMEILADHASIFVYVLIPPSLAALVVVLARQFA